MPDSGDLWYSAGFSVLVSGFCFFKAFTSPFCLAAIIAAYAPFVRWCRGSYSAWRELFDATGFFTLAWLFILFITPFVILYMSGKHPPYRVVNMVFFFLMTGLVYFGTLAVNRRVNMRLPFVSRYRNIAIVLLLAAGFMRKNNVSIAVGELRSGSAYQYNEEMNDRYRLIMQCRGDSCVVPHLRHSSFTLRYDSADLNDPHISDYFHKRVIVR